MEYVEMMRARRVLTWYTGFLIAGLVIKAISILPRSRQQPGDGTVAFSSVAGAAALGAILIATFIVPGPQCRSRDTTPLIFTRPAPRDRSPGGSLPSTPLPS